MTLQRSRRKCATWWEVTADARATSDGPETVAHIPRGHAYRMSALAERSLAHAAGRGSSPTRVHSPGRVGVNGQKWPLQTSNGNREAPLAGSHSSPRAKRPIARRVSTRGLRSRGSTGRHPVVLHFVIYLHRSGASRAIRIRCAMGGTGLATT